MDVVLMVCLKLLPLRRAVVVVALSGSWDSRLPNASRTEVLADAQVHSGRALHAHHQRSRRRIRHIASTQIDAVDRANVHGRTSAMVSAVTRPKAAGQREVGFGRIGDLLNRFHDRWTNIAIRIVSCAPTDVTRTSVAV